MRFGVQTLEYSKERKKGMEIGPQDSEGSEVRTETYGESKERDFNKQEGGGSWHFLPEPKLTV